MKEVTVFSKPCCLIHVRLGGLTIADNGAWVLCGTLQGSASLLLPTPCPRTFLPLRLTLAYYNFRLRRTVRDQLAQAPCFKLWGN